MTLEVGFASHPGRKRRSNQDAIGVFLADSRDQMPPILIVADGMGGHSGGEVASRLAVDTIQNHFTQGGKSGDYGVLLVESVQAAHAQIREMAAHNAQLSDMGTTVVAAVILPGRVFLANVGDSRAHLVRRGEIRLLSLDHSYVAEQVRAGLITESEARRHPQRNRLTMAISARQAKVKPYLAELALEDGDILVLSTDGLWGAVPESILAAIVGELPPQAAADKLVSLANQNLGPDNISVIVARYCL